MTPPKHKLPAQSSCGVPSPLQQLPEGATKQISSRASHTYVTQHENKKLLLVPACIAPYFHVEKKGRAWPCTTTTLWQYRGRFEDTRAASTSITTPGGNATFRRYVRERTLPGLLTKLDLFFSIYSLYCAAFRGIDSVFIRHARRDCCSFQPWVSQRSYFR